MRCNTTGRYTCRIFHICCLENWVNTSVYVFADWYIGVHIHLCQGNRQYISIYFMVADNTHLCISEFQTIHIWVFQSYRQYTSCISELQTIHIHVFQGNRQYFSHGKAIQCCNQTAQHGPTVPWVSSRYKAHNSSCKPVLCAAFAMFGIQDLLKYRDFGCPLCLFMMLGELFESLVWCFVYICQSNISRKEKQEWEWLSNGANTLKHNDVGVACYMVQGRLVLGGTASCTSLFWCVIIFYVCIWLMWTNLLASSVFC